MDLSNTIKATILSGKQRLCAFSDLLKSQIKSNLADISAMLPIVDILSGVTSTEDSDIPAEEAASFIAQVISNAVGDLTSKAFSGSTDQGNPFSVIISKTDDQNFNAIVKGVNGLDDSVLYTTTILSVVAGAIDVAIDPVIDAIPISPDESLTVGEIISEMQNSTTGMQIMQCATDLYSEGQFTASNFRTRIETTLDIVIDDYKSLIAIIMDNIGTMSASYDNFIEFAKSILNKIRDISSSSGKFTYGVDNYKVDSSVFVGVDTIINIVSTVISTVTMLFAPIASVVTSLVGKAASAIAEAIHENTRSTCMFTDDPSFSGFGQNACRAYVRDNNNIIYNAFVNDDKSIICVSTPLTTAIIYNAPKKDSQNYDVYPCQEFIIPFVPLDVTIPNKVQYMITNGNAMTVNDSSAAVSPYGAVYKCTVGLSGSNYSSAATRRGFYYEIMQSINVTPSCVHFISDGDDDYTCKFGTWYATMLYMYSIHSLSPEYTSLSYSVNIVDAMAAHNTNSPTNINDLMNAEKLVDFYIINRALSFGIAAKPYSNTSTLGPDGWFKDLMSGTYSSGMYYLPALGCLTLTWAGLVNVYLNSAPGYGSIFSTITAITANSIPYGVFSIRENDRLNPSIIPPQAEVNIWARLAVTLGVLAVTAAAAAISYVVIRKQAQKSFYKSANAATKAYNRWQETGSKEDWRAFKLQNVKTNIIGKIFGLGSFDAANDWINRPEIGTATIISNLSALSGNSDGVISPNIKDIVDLIH